MNGKNPPANAGGQGSTPGSGRPPGGGHGHPLHVLAWESPWAEAPGGLQSVGQRVRHGWWIRPACAACSTRVGTLCWPKGECSSKERAHLIMELIHFAVQWEVIQRCKATVLQWQCVFKNGFWDIENRRMVTSGERTGGKMVQEIKRCRLVRLK